MPVDTVHYSPGFVPYGTPCSEDVDPGRARLCRARGRVEELRKEIAALKTRRAQPAAEGQKRLSVITPFPHPRDRRPIAAFDRLELLRILDLYGRMVAAGHWRDYAM